MSIRRNPIDLYFCACFGSKQFADRINKRYVMPDRIALFFVDEGEIEVCVDGKDYSVGKEDMLLLHPRQEVTIMSFGADAKLYIIGFMPALQDVVSKQFSLQFFSHLHRKIVWRLDERTRIALRAFYNLFDYNYNVMPGQYTTEIANSLFSVFMQLFYQNVKDAVRTENVDSGTVTTRTLVGRFFELLKSNYKLEHSVTFYADSLCVSGKYLSQVIKSTCGLTPKEIIDKRLGVEAVFMLTKTEKNVQQISYELGFSDQSYFGRFFKRLFNISPLNYRLNPDMSLLENLE